MLESTKKAITAYKTLLKKSKLEEKEYATNFTLFSFCSKEEVKKVTIKIKTDLYELSPFIAFITPKGELGIMDKKFIKDVYDLDSIKEDFTELEDGGFYDAKIISKVLKAMKLKKT